MRLKFFEKELDKVQERFNQTFGIMTVCDLKLRQSVILAICHLGCLVRTMTETKSRDHPHNKIARFMRTRNAINRVFDQLEKHQEKGRKQNDRNGQRKETDTGVNYFNKGAAHRTNRYNVQKSALP